MSVVRKSFRLAERCHVCICPVKGDAERARDAMVRVGTAGVHIEHILRKLDLRSRHQVTDWAKAHGLVSD
jgi:hypothetical protein